MGTYIILSERPSPEPTNFLESATSTVSIVDLFTRADGMESVLDRQDFLEKYIGSFVSGRGVVSEVSRAGSGYIVDIRIAGHLVSCQLESNEENDRLVLLLKGKVVDLTGEFTFSNIFGHGLGIDNCKFFKKMLCPPNVSYSPLFPSWLHEVERI